MRGFGPCGGVLHLRYLPHPRLHDRLVRDPSLIGLLADDRAPAPGAEHPPGRALSGRVRGIGRPERRRAAQGSRGSEPLGAQAPLHHCPPAAAVHARATPLPVGRQTHPRAFGTRSGRHDEGAPPPASDTSTPPRVERPLESPITGCKESPASAGHASQWCQDRATPLRARRQALLDDRQTRL